MSRTYPLDKPIPASKKLAQLKARRKVWLQVHLWLALVFGFWLALIGLTGAVLVFWHELDVAINPQLYQSASSSHADRKPLDDLIAVAERAAPKGWNGAWLDAPTESGNYVFGFYYPKSSPPPDEAESLSISVDPTTADIAGRRVFYHAWHPFKHSLMGFFFKLHYALFLGETGVTIVGILAVLFFVSVLTGLILWWPLTGKWKRALTIKPKASSERLNHDLHQTAGFYSAIVMLALLISGIYFNLPDQFRWLVQQFSPLTPDAKASAQNLLPTTAGVLENALQKIAKTIPEAKPQYYSFAADLAVPFTACFQDVAELRQYVLDTRCYELHRGTGVILAIKDAAHGSGGDVFMQWQWPLHSGQAFGWTGRILVCITGLICPLLFVTGVIRWLQKRRGRQKMAARQVS